MGKKVPKGVAKEIKETVFREADQINYLAQARNNNGMFFDQLVSMPEVGGRLSGFMPKSEIRTYIKDSILNRYSKNKAQEERPNSDDLILIIKQLLEIDAHFVECKSKVTLFKSPINNCFIVIADGALLKWETALRKALLYLTAKPFFDQKDMEINIILTLFARGEKVTPSNMHHLEKSLSLCNAIPYLYGEG